MIKIHLPAAAVALMTAALALPASQAGAIDTFTFSQVGWTSVILNAPTMSTAGASDPGAILTGSFTGTVESNGLIELGDLTSFSAFYQDSAAGQSFVAASPLALDLFSYNINGGNSSLDFAVEGGSGVSEACAGAAASLDPACLDVRFVPNPAGTNGAVITTFSYVASNPVLGMYVTGIYPY